MADHLKLLDQEEMADHQKRVELVDNDVINSHLEGCVVHIDIFRSLFVFVMF